MLAPRKKKALRTPRLYITIQQAVSQAGPLPLPTLCLH